MPAFEWGRGLRRLADYANRHRTETGCTHILAATTPVDVQDDAHVFTSPARVFAFNQLIFDVARRHGLIVLDAWAPLDARQDARVDRVHMCSQLVVEWGRIILAALASVPAA